MIKTVVFHIKRYFQERPLPLPLLALIVCSFIAYPLISNATSTKTAKVKFMSYNILVQPYGDKIAPSYPWKNRKTTIARYIEGSKSSAVGLQEARYPQQRAELKKLLSSKWKMTSHTNLDGENAILWDSATQTALSQGWKKIWTQSQFTTSDKKLTYMSETRWITWLRLQDKASGITYYVFNTHLDHKSHDLRTKQAAASLAIINQVAGKTSDPIILLGDFNASEGTKPHSTILNSGYLNARTTAPTKQNAAFTTFTSFNPNKTGSFHPDHIFYKKNAMVTPIKYVTDTNLWRGSDHLPIYAWFTFTIAPPVITPTEPKVPVKEPETPTVPKTPTTPEVPVSPETPKETPVTPPTEPEEPHTPPTPVLEPINVEPPVRRIPEAPTTPETPKQETPAPVTPAPVQPQQPHTPVQNTPIPVAVEDEAYPIGSEDTDQGAVAIATDENTPEDTVATTAPTLSEPSKNTASISSQKSTGLSYQTVLIATAGAIATIIGIITAAVITVKTRERKRRPTRLF